MKPEFGLKARVEMLVAPRRGAWIETFPKVSVGEKVKRRTPQGCVD